MPEPSLITRTGRVQSWMDAPHGRLPMSCTVYVVKDSMEGPEGIEASWRFASHALRYGAGCAIHLSELRAVGETNARGLVASGPLSFAKIYSVLNEILRRGGQYKNGAITLHLDWDHPDLGDRVVGGHLFKGFLNTSRAELPWVKRCVDVPDDTGGWIADLEERGLLADLIKAIARGDVWLNKIKFDSNGNRVYGNVCLEVYLLSRDTCLLEHVNTGACAVADLAEAFPMGMKELVELHSRTGAGDTGEYLSPEEGKQVGLGLLGFANFLAQEGVGYWEMANALEGKPADAKPKAIVKHLRRGIRAAEEIARQAGMERAFCIAPTATCSYKSRDLRGFACTPEIAPPVARAVDRDSGTFGVETVQYPYDIEIAKEVGYETFRRVADGIVRLFEETGLFHGYSLNSWSDEVTYDRKFLEDWAKSPQTSLYYSLQVAPDTQAKDRVSAGAGGEMSVGVEFFGFEEEEVGKSCSIEDPAFCAACAE